MPDDGLGLQLFFTRTPFFTPTVKKAQTVKKNARARCQLTSIEGILLSYFFSLYIYIEEG